MTSPVWDAVVVGAGPAGSAAALGALRADPHARVLLLDAADFPRDKVCGDGIAPHAIDVLAGLGVDPAALTAGTEPVTRLRLVSPGGVVAARTTARPAYVVPRETFDHRLVEAAVAAGAVLQRERVRTVEPHADGVVVNGRHRARVVVGADGAESVVRRAVGAAAPGRGTIAIALRGYAQPESFPAGEQALVLSRAHWPAYAWAFPVGDGRVNVGYGELVQQTPPNRTHLERRLRELLPASLHPAALRGHRLPLSPGRPALAHGRVLLAGDAASLINPLTGEGIYYAVLSGALAGAAVSAPDPAREYRGRVRSALGLHWRNTDLLARCGRWPVLTDLAIGAARDRPASFDALVEIGLGAGLSGPALLGPMLSAGVRGLRPGGGRRRSSAVPAGTAAGSSGSR